MTDKLTYINEVSLRYAKALILASKKMGIEPILKDFKNLITLIEKNSTIKDFISNPLINSVKKSDIMKKVCKDLKTDDKFLGFIETLSKHNKVMLISKVFDQFNKLIDASKGIMEVSITTASRLEDDKAKKIEKVLSEKINSKIRLKKIIDPQIIGGIIIQINSNMIDNSVKTKLSENNL